MKTKVFCATMILVLFSGTILPGMQSSGHPRPVITSVLSVLFFLEGPAQHWGITDLDAGMLFLRFVSTIIWGAVLGCVLVIFSVGVGRLLRQMKPLATNTDPPHRPPSASQPAEQQE